MRVSNLSLLCVAQSDEKRKIWFCKVLQRRGVKRTQLPVRRLLLKTHLFILLAESTSIIAVIVIKDQYYKTPAILSCREKVIHNS